MLSIDTPTALVKPLRASTLIGCNRPIRCHTRGCPDPGTHMLLWLDMSGQHPTTHYTVLCDRHTDLWAQRHPDLITTDPPDPAR